MKQSKTQLKKSQERTIKVIGLVLAAIIFVTFVLSSSSMKISASVVRSPQATSSKQKYPTKPSVPSCPVSCTKALATCTNSKEGATTCNYFYDRCMAMCPRM